ncbi:MAG TPA: hypothetical protein VMV53_04850 [Acidimicrobiales bacterium]|nr:hypothetical protein [Acidimicrobiales bacterium]
MSEAKPPLTTTTSIVPAMIVLLIAAGTLVVFLAINFIANPRVATSSTTVPIVVGALALDQANPVLHGCIQAGSPPSNVIGSLIVPVKTSATGAIVHPNGGAGDYDCLRPLATTASPGELLGFYSAQLQAQGWSLFSHGSSHAVAQLLFQKAGSDTFYWIVGITVNAVHGNTSQWTFRIYQNSSSI